MSNRFMGESPTASVDDTSEYRSWFEEGGTGGSVLFAIEDLLQDIENDEDFTHGDKSFLVKMKEQFESTSKQVIRQKVSKLERKKEQKRKEAKGEQNECTPRLSSAI